LIGKPLAMILADMFATVTLTHVGTYDAGRLAYHIGNADIVISAVGKPGLVKGEWIKENAIVIDVGTGVKDNKICGDIEFDAACQRAALVTPVPGGVGKLTTLFLFENLVKAGQFRNYEKQGR
jgi:methylenetetrahydrofolate dehydrogenase (NADP+)/methenyltetrahydrofolate cyclohydrolase